MKRCYACKVEKTFDNFCNNKASKDGINGICKYCQSNRNLSEAAKQNKKAANNAE